jgi:hypothetical protein
VRRFFRALELILTLKCDHAERLMSEELDRGLSFPERWAVRFHTHLCRSCKRFRSQLRLLRDAARSLTRTPTAVNPLALPTEAKDRIERVLREHMERP